MQNECFLCSISYNYECFQKNEIYYKCYTFISGDRINLVLSSFLLKSEKVKLFLFG